MRTIAPASTLRLGAVFVCLVLALAGSVALARPLPVAAAELVPTTTEISVSPNPTPQGESTYITARVAPAPAVNAAVEFVYARSTGDGWDYVAHVDLDGVASVSPELPVGTYEVTAFFLGTTDFAPSTSATQAFAVMERIVATPGFRFGLPTIYADQTVPFTIWARPTPLTGDLRLNASTWVKSDEFPATAESQGTLDFDYGNYDESGGYRVFAELRHSSSAAKGCPVTVLPQLRPDDPQLAVSSTSAPAGTHVTFDLSVFDPSVMPGIYGFLSAELHFRHEDGREEISGDADIASGRGSYVWSLPRPGIYDVWFTLTDYIWSVPESNHVSITVLPFYDQPFRPVRDAQPGAQATTTTLDPLPSSGWKNDPILFRVTVSPAPSSGRLTIEDGSSGVTLLNPTGTPGVYEASGYRLSAGPHRFRAMYDGNASFAPSASEPQDVFADSIPTTTTLTFSPDHPDALTNVTVTATVTPVPPSGTVYVYRDGTLELWGQVNKATGQVSWTSTWPTWAIHHLTAQFVYGGTFADSHSDPVTLEVSTVPAEVTLSGPTEIAHAGEQVTLTAAFDQAPATYANLVLYVDDGYVAQWSVTTNPLVIHASFRPGQHKVRVKYTAQPGVGGWSDELTVNVGPYANRAGIHGTVVVNHGNPYANSELVLIEPSLTAGSAYATYLQLSNDAVHWATFSYVNGWNNSLLWDVTDAGCGGSGGSGSHRIYYRWTDYHGSDGVPIESVDVTITDSESSGLAIDQIAPTVSTPGASAAAHAASAGSPVATTIAWSGSDNLSGIASYELEMSVDGGDWQEVALDDATSSSADLELAAGSQYQFRVRARDRAGNLSGWSTSGVHIPSEPADVTPPMVFAPIAEIVGGSALASKPLVRVSWPAGTDDGGLASYRLETRTNASAWKPATLSGLLATSVTLRLSTGASYGLRLCATDVAGNTSNYVTGAAFKLVRLQEKATAVKYVGAWRRVALAGASGGYVKKASVSGAKATYTFSGRWIAIASTLGPNRGTVRVSLNGTVTTIDLYSPTTRPGWLVLSVGMSAGSHTLVVQPTGLKNVLSSGARVDLDALIVLQ